MKPIGVSTPAWSFVGIKNHEVKNMMSPGPGAHTVSTGERATWHANPKWVFGTSNREGWDGNINPGPGTYWEEDEVPGETDIKGDKKKIHKLNDDKKTTFTNGKRTENPTAKMQFPGPGSYHHKPITKAPPKFGFGYKEESKLFSSENELGPGQYNPQFTLQEFRRFNKFGTEPKDKLHQTYNSCAPGSAKYFPMEMHKRSSTKGTFGKSTRDDIKSSNMLSPGPANYRY